MNVFVTLTSLIQFFPFARIVKSSRASSNLPLPTYKSILKIQPENLYRDAPAVFANRRQISSIRNSPRVVVIIIGRLEFAYCEPKRPSDRRIYYVSSFVHVVLKGTLYIHMNNSFGIHKVNYLLCVCAALCALSWRFFTNLIAMTGRWMVDRWRDS